MKNPRAVQSSPDHRATLRPEKGWQALLLAVALVPGSASGQMTFTDISAQAGVELDSLLVESVAWGDYDNDGDVDLYLTANGPNHLLRNDGGGNFTDVSAEAGVDHGGFGVGTGWADLDNDGDLDLYVVNFGAGPDVLYRNDGPVGAGGAWQFTDHTAAAGITDQTSSRGMAYLDFNRDGLLDIYVNAIGADILYRNDGELGFTNVAAAVGIVGVDGQGVGVVATDVDNDGWLDLFTGNRSSAPNVLFHNQGGTFADITADAGITEVGLGMGVLAFDYDNDLAMDLYWTTWPDLVNPVSNALYHQTTSEGGTPIFTNEAAPSGTTDTDGWGISCNAGDLDNDGWQDFAVTNGFDPNTTANVLFHNQGNGTFADVTAALGGGDFDGRGVAFADFDNDGDLDIAWTSDVGEATRLWRNDTVNSHRWLSVELSGRRSNRSAIGARIEVTTDLGTQVQEVSGGAGRGSFNSLPVEFGLGNATALVEVFIRWPSGVEQTLTEVDLDQRLQVIEEAFFADGFESGDTGAWGATRGAVQ